MRPFHRRRWTGADYKHAAVFSACVCLGTGFFGLGCAHFAAPEDEPALAMALSLLSWTLVGIGAFVATVAVIVRHSVDLPAD